MSAKKSQSPKRMEIKDHPVAYLCSVDDIGRHTNMINMVVVSAVTGTVLLGLLAAVL